MWSPYREPAADGPIEHCIVSHTPKWEGHTPLVRFQAATAKRAGKEPMFDRLATHLGILADQVEQEMLSRNKAGKSVIRDRVDPVASPAMSAMPPKAEVDSEH
jgi:hypothetical protein